MSWVRHKHCARSRPLGGRLGCWRECLSLQAHLAWCELKLRLRTRSDQHRRWQVLDSLHRYWRAGRFPQNHFPVAGRLPIFIDDAGTHCAVGQLMAETGAADLAQEVNRRRRFVYLEEVDLDQEPEIKQWLTRYQLKPDEAALIQPTYGWDPGWVSFEPTHIHGGLSTGDWLIAIASIIFSLGLLLPTAVLIFLARRSFVDRLALFLRRLGELLLVMLAVGLLLLMLVFFRFESLLLGPGHIFTIVNLSAWVVFFGLIVRWVWCCWRAQPMPGFDVANNCYRPARRLLLYILGAIFLAGTLPAMGLWPQAPIVPSWLIYLNLLALLVLSLLLAHRPLQACQLGVRRVIFGGFLASVLVLTFILPSPVYTFDQLVTWSPGDDASCQGWVRGWRPMSCWEIDGGLPKLLQPSTWKPYSWEVRDPWL